MEKKNINELNEGGIISINNNKFIITKILKYKDIDYLFCSTTQKDDIRPIVFEYKKLETTYAVRVVENVQIVKEICQFIHDEEIG